jgi:hypothetical protein
MHLISDKVAEQRVTKWLAEAKSITERPSWTETRLAIEIGGHLHILERGRVFDCPKCGHLDPGSSTATEVIKFFKETLGIEPIEIEVTCTVAPKYLE